MTIERVEEWGSEGGADGTPLLGYTYLRHWPDGFVDVWARVWPGAAVANPCQAGLEDDPGPHPSDRGICRPGCGIVGFARPEDLLAARFRTHEDHQPGTFIFQTILGEDTRLPGIRDGIYAIVSLGGRIVRDLDGDHWAERARVVAAVAWKAPGSMSSIADAEVLDAQLGESDSGVRHRISRLWHDHDRPTPGSDPAEVVAAELHRLTAEVLAGPPPPEVRAVCRAEIARIRSEADAPRRRSAPVSRVSSLQAEPWGVGT